MSCKIEKVVMSPREIRQEADKLAQRVLGISGDQALSLVRSGEYDGTMFAAELESLYFLLEDHSNPYQTAAE